MRSTISSGRRIPSVWSIMNPVRAQIRFAMLLSSLAAFSTLVSLSALAWGVHTLIMVPAQWPWQALGTSALCTIIAYTLRLHAFSQSHYAAFRLETILRTRLSEHLARVPLGYVQQIGAGALAKVIQDDVKALHIFVADSTPLYARAYTAPLVTFVALWWLDWRLALAATSILALGCIVLALAMRGRSELVRQYNAARERISTAVVEYVQAMPVVRSFDSGHATFGRYQQALEAYRDIVTQWYRQSGFASRFALTILNPLPTLTVLLWLGSWLLWHDTLDFSIWLAVLLLGSGMAESMLPLMSLKHLIDRTEMSVHRIHEVMAEPILPVPEANVARQPHNASVRFEGVSFRYHNSGHDVLHSINFEASPGSITALVGPSGAGKTTVARLIPRFWDVNAGRILIGDIDVREMTPETLMAQVAFVFQDTFLFSDSIADNIRLGQPTATLDEVISAAKAAQAHDFIMALPQGYDTAAGERGVFLSGGQRQRITIARAILQNRPILVLDEATAFADPENEAALVAALSVLMRGKTVIMVAHRLSTIRDADQILVFDHGHLAEVGQHDSLLNQQGIYARLWHSYEQARDWSLGTAFAHNSHTSTV